MGPLASGPAAIDMNASSAVHENPATNSPSRCTSFVRFTSAASILGTTVDIIALGAASVGVATGDPVPFYVVLGASGCSAVAHTVQGIATCIWAPESRVKNL